MLRLISQGHTPESAALRLGIAEEETTKEEITHESVLELEINANLAETDYEIDQQFNPE